YASTLNYTHSSDVKSLQELFGVAGPNGVFLGDANTPGTNDLSDLFVPGALTPFGVSQTGPVYSRANKTSTVGLTVTNTSQFTMAGSFEVVLGSLSAGVTLSSASVTVNGKTINLAVSTDAAGNVIITIPSSVAASLAPGQSLPSIALVFSNPT